MKKNLSLIMAFLMMASLEAQWVNDPAINTLVASGTSEYGEIYISTDEASGNTFLQWNSMISGGWNPSMQMINVDGVPQWGENGIVVSDHQNETMSYGVSMVTTTDGCVVSHFADIRNGELQPHAVKINAEGEFVWGYDGIQTFTVGSNGACRTELFAGNDGGVWAVANDGLDVFARYINADGTMNEQILIHDKNGRSIFYPQAVVNDENDIFIVYQNAQYAYTYYYNKEIYVEKYSKDGTQLHEPELLMSDVNMASYLETQVVADTKGGGYAWIWHPATGLFETYVFHFDADGNNTFPDTYGLTLDVPDGVNYHFYADGDVEPATNDIVFAWRSTDAAYEAYNTLKINRVTETGDKVWSNEGIALLPTSENELGEIAVNLMPNNNGMVVSYQTGGYTSALIKAIGIDLNGNMLWQSDISSYPSSKSMFSYTAGFHNGQLIFAWDDQRPNAGLYVQNVQADGTLGPVSPSSCLPPVNIEGTYYYNEDNQQFGSLLEWENNEPSVNSFNIYRSTDGNNYQLIGNVASSVLTYYDILTEIGEYYYQVTAVYYDCESDPGTSVTGEDYVIVSVTSVEENETSKLKIWQDNQTITLSGLDIADVEMYNVAGQLVDKINNNGGENVLINIGVHNSGVYLLRVMTRNHQSITKRVVVHK